MSGIHMDLSEGQYTKLCCLECHEDHDARITMTGTYLVYALECTECQGEIVRWDAL